VKYERRAKPNQVAFTKRERVKTVARGIGGPGGI